MASWSERELEDWLCTHIPEFFGSEYDYLGRQVVLPDGKIIDMLLRSDITGQIVVVELKAVEANGDALAQLLCYMRLMRLVILRPEYVKLIQPALAAESDGAQWALQPRGILVAPSFTEYVSVAADGLPGVDLRFAQMCWQPAYLSQTWVSAKAEGDCREAINDALTLNAHLLNAQFQQEATDGEDTVGEDHDGHVNQPEHCGLAG